MFQSKVFAGGLIFATVALLLAAIYVPQSRLRRELKGTGAQVARSLHRFERAYKVEKLRSVAFNESLRTGQEEVLSLLHNLLDRARAMDERETVRDNATERLTVELSGVEENGDEELDLPPLPENMAAMGLMESLDIENFAGILDDPFLNPGGKELTSVQKAELAAVVAETKGTMETLDRQVAAIAIKGMEELRGRADYVDYSKGEPYHKEKGVFTAAERIENEGTRMFYLFPDEFPEIYKKRRQKMTVAKNGVRKLLSIFATDPTD